MDRYIIDLINNGKEIDFVNNFESIINDSNPKALLSEEVIPIV